MAEDSWRAKEECIRLQKEEAKAQELQFYRELVQRNMPTPQIESLKATFNAQYLPQWGYTAYPIPPPQQAWPTPAPEYTPPAQYRLHSPLSTNLSPLGTLPQLRQ